jgi:hypothetical protein
MRASPERAARCTYIDGEAGPWIDTSLRIEKFVVQVGKIVSFGGVMVVEKIKELTSGRSSRHR